MAILKQIGSDVEFFVSKGGEVGSAIGLIGGSKSTPVLVEHGNLQEDNVLAEMAIDPCDDVDAWQTKLSVVKNKLSSVLASQGYVTVTKSSHHYTKEQLLGWGGMAMEMGCMPDFNVYTQEENPKPSARTVLRTAAGHVHFSYVNPSLEETTNIVKCLDATLGLWSVITDRDLFRRNLYGKAGCCRIKEYGGEYRTLGNFWTSNFARQRYVFDVTKLCVEQHGVLLPKLRLLAKEATVIDIINNSDVERAQVLMPSIETIIHNALSKGDGYA